jgi:hypothetical protein
VAGYRVLSARALLLNVDAVTYARYHNHVTVLPFSHRWEDGFDDIHVGEEIDLEDFVYKTNCSATLRQFFDGANDSCTIIQVSSEQVHDSIALPSLAAQSNTSMRPNASTASATAA